MTDDFAGHTPEECWQDLLDKDDRTSPEDYPDMALITFDELRGYMTLAAEARVAELQAKLAKAREGLEPFAKAWRAWEAGNTHVSAADLGQAVGSKIFRRAARALEETKP